MVWYLLVSQTSSAMFSQVVECQYQPHNDHQQDTSHQTHICHSSHCMATNLQIIPRGGHVLSPRPIYGVQSSDGDLSAAVQPHVTRNHEAKEVVFGGLADKLNVGARCSLMPCDINANLRSL
jgi:hypothetical protein